MKKAITTGALICALAVGMTGKPNEAPAKIQQSLNPQGPSSLTIHNEKRTICYAGHSDDNPTNWQTAVKRPDWWLVFIAALTGFVIYLQAREMTRATKEMQASTDVAKKTLVLTQRPRIAVRAFYFTETRGVGGAYLAANGIEPGSFCSGQFYILNCGGTDARIREIYSTVYINANLPMKRPYEGQVGSQEEKTLGPGQSTFYLFGRMEPLDDATALQISAMTTNFYVLGWIGYTDDLGIYRITAFCRQYDRLKDRFVPVNDEDYEYAD